LAVAPPAGAPAPAALALAAHEGDDSTAARASCSARLAVGVITAPTSAPITIVAPSPHCTKNSLQRCPSLARYAPARSTSSSPGLMSQRSIVYSTRCSVGRLRGSLRAPTANMIG